jgi:hypothetical protein
MGREQAGWCMWNRKPTNHAEHTSFSDLEHGHVGVLTRGGLVVKTNRRLHSCFCFCGGRTSGGQSNRRLHSSCLCGFPMGKTTACVATRQQPSLQAADTLPCRTAFRASAGPRQITRVPVEGSLHLCCGFCFVLVHKGGAAHALLWVPVQPSLADGLLSPRRRQTQARWWAGLLRECWG